MEQVRSCIEEAECMELAISSSLSKRVDGGGELSRILLDFKVNHFIESAMTITREIREKSIFKDLVQTEITRIRNDGLAAFYAEKRKINEFYSKNPNESNGKSVVEMCLEKGDVKPDWRGEEHYGKYLDLHSLFNAFLNLKNVEKISYVDYLGHMSKLYELDIQKVKSSKEYSQYLRELIEYLTSFHQRARPLVVLELDKCFENFEENWAKGKVVGWERSELETNASPERLFENLGTEKLKTELLVRGFKAGGTDMERARRLAMVASSTLPDEKTMKKITLCDAKSIARLEAHVQLLTDCLGQFVDATQDYIMRKQTRTFDEILQEMRDENAAVRAGDKDVLYDDADDDNDMIINNPLNIPLDFDGKPIPYWLYKLHGLGVEYKCEICGNYSYWGRREFDRHFQQWRHQYGMRSLGIPNSSHFHDITSIEDARNLYAKLQSQIKTQVFDRNAQEQFEDSEGNILTKKEYNDLLKQGLL